MKTSLLLIGGLSPAPARRSGRELLRHPGMALLRVLAGPRTRSGVMRLSLVAALGAVAGPADAPAQEYVRVEGTVAWITGNSMRLYIDSPSVPPAYVISGGYFVPVPQPRQTVDVDLRGLPQTEYSFMRPGERVAVIGDFYSDRRLLVATSLIRGPGMQAP
jgi:hypothetical protein